MKGPKPKILLIVKISLIEQIVITHAELHKDNYWRVFRATLYFLLEYRQNPTKPKTRGGRG